MTRYFPDDLPAGRETLRGGIAQGTVSDRLLALAWARLAGPVAPPNTANPDRVLVVRAFSVNGGQS